MLLTVKMTCWYITADFLIYFLNSSPANFVYSWCFKNMERKITNPLCFDYMITEYVSSLN